MAHYQTGERETDSNEASPGHSSDIPPVQSDTNRSNVNFGTPARTGPPDVHSLSSRERGRGSAGGVVVYPLAREVFGVGREQYVDAVVIRRTCPNQK